MPTANVPLWALGGRGAKEWGDFWSGTCEYFWHSLLGITRLGRLLAWSGDLGAHSYQKCSYIFIAHGAAKCYLIGPRFTQRLLKERMWSRGRGRLLKCNFGSRRLVLLPCCPRGIQVLSHCSTGHPKTDKRTCVPTGQWPFGSSVPLV